MPKTASEAARPISHEGASAPAERLIRLPRFLELTGRGRTATLDDVRAGAFPKPVKLGAATVWLESEVQAWIAERVRQARGA